MRVMTNLEKMKNILTEQIKGMDVTEFERLLEILGEHRYPEERLDSLDLSGMFDCETCKKEYGSCNEDDEDRCSRRFAKFAARTTV